MSLISRISAVVVRIAQEIASKEPKIVTKNTAFNKNFGSAAGTVAEGNHGHAAYADINFEKQVGIYGSPYYGKMSSSSFTWGGSSIELVKTYSPPAAGEYLPITSDAVYTALLSKSDSGHNHTGTYEPVFTKNSAFNKNFGSAVGTVCQGNDSRLSDSRPASDVSTWAKAGTKPTYSYSEVGAAASSHTHSTYALLAGSTSQAFSASIFNLPNSCNVNSNSSVLRLVNGSYSLALNSSGNGSIDGSFTAGGIVKGSEVERGSSRELKIRIEKFKGSATEILINTEIDTYILKENNSFGIGFIAEDSHEWLSGKEKKSHLMGNHLGLLTKAFQEQNEKMNMLSDEIERLIELIENGNK